jgi:hypothetical protein
VCPWANQPAENVTAPGSQIRDAIEVTKFFLCVRQFGADFPGAAFRIDL